MSRQGAYDLAVPGEGGKIFGKGYSGSGGPSGLGPGIGPTAGGGVSVVSIYALFNWFATTGRTVRANRIERGIMGRSDRLAFSIIIGGLAFIGGAWLMYRLFGYFYLLVFLTVAGMFVMFGLIGKYFQNYDKKD